MGPKFGYFIYYRECDVLPAGFFDGSIAPGRESSRWAPYASR